MISSVWIWLVFVIVGVGTFMLRAVGILMLGSGELSPRLRRWLEMVGPAVLAALVASSVAKPGSSLTSAGIECLCLALASVVAWRTRNVVLTLLAGMICLWSLRAWLG